MLDCSEKEAFSRLLLLIGKEAVNRLNGCKILVFGLGGVGGFVVEALGRSAVGQIDLVDGDFFCASNLNRQILSTTKTIGKSKVLVAKERLKLINPKIKVNCFNFFYSKETQDDVSFKGYDYIIDAIDDLDAKLLIILKANLYKIDIISCMGTGFRLCSNGFEITDIFKTSYCPMARKMRIKLKKEGVKKLKVIYSKQKPEYLKSGLSDKKIVASAVFSPAIAGLKIAEYVVSQLLDKNINLINIKKS